MLTKSAVQDLKIQCATLPVGSRIPQSLCPTCGGGVTKERTFAINIDSDGVKFFCHRSSCGERGVIQINGMKSLRDVKPDAGLRPFTHNTAALDDEDFKQFEAQYGIYAQELLDNNVVKCPERGSYIFPSYNIIGQEIGKVERWYSWQKDSAAHRGPKSFYYREVDHPKMYVPKSCTIGDKVIVVEDTLSAIKLGRMYTTCALLGTHLTNEVLIRLKDAKVKELILILDPDALTKAISIKKEYALYFDNISTVLVPKDPKDMAYEELQELLCAL